MDRLNIAYDLLSYLPNEDKNFIKTVSEEFDYKDTRILLYPMVPR